ncbi:hypothetical protein KP509_17G077900 [Ceratopteris richardii]|uniref:Exostosin GT47 domain-containing protein n=1 Tax=Ceratopteris richardii TaxID=49495 RepID=A0A8T2SVM3_CERRI|nr:hypothetical protein KP509_17G077900 [Ceratopteris richardii]
MDWVKGREGWPSWRLQAKKPLIAIAIIFAAGLLYMQLKKDYRWFKDPVINSHLQRGYSTGGSWNEEPQMLKDYSYNARVYDSDNVNNLQTTDSDALNTTLKGVDYAPKQMGNTSRKFSPDNSNKSLSLSNQEGLMKEGNAGCDNNAFKARDEVASSANSETDVIQQKMNGEDSGDSNVLHGGNVNVVTIVKKDLGREGNHSMMNTGESIYQKQSNHTRASPSVVYGSSDSMESSAVNTIDKVTIPNGSKSPVSATSSTPGSPCTRRVPSQYNLTQDCNSSRTKQQPSNSQRKAPLWLYSRLELQLYAAKLVIENAPYSNTSSNNALHPPIYRNLSRFIRSYELMEKMFRVYIYKEGSKPLVHTGPALGIYCSEGLFITQMERSKQFRTDSWEEALAFFLPYSVANMVDELYVPPSTSMLPLSSFIRDYVNAVASHHPFWNRTRGGDHFFVSCHDWGLMTTFEHAELRQNAIKVLCNADATTEFEEGRDASLPEFYLHAGETLGEGGTEEDLLTSAQRSLRRRDTLAFFAGQMHGRVRPKLLEYWEYPKGGEKMQVYGVLPEDKTRRMPYSQRMQSSRFCLCPMGYEVNSPRLVEAIHALCVPVIIADGFVLPFSDVLDWGSFSITVPEKDLPSLKPILEAVPEHAYSAMQENLRHVRRHFTWYKEPQPFDTFHMILHSVWTSRLKNITAV